jgi:Caspase domain
MIEVFKRFQNRSQIRSVMWVFISLATLGGRPVSAGHSGPVFGSVGPKPRLFVLSIGINKYKNPNVPYLVYARADAEMAGSELMKRAGQDIYKEVKGVRYLLDEDASRAGIINALDSLQTELAATDTLIVFFAGRGMAYERQQHRGIELEGNTAASFYLFPSDMDPDKVEETGISSEVLQVYLRNIRARNKLFVFDSCHSGFGYDSIAETFTRRERRATGENTLFIGVDTLSYDDRSRGHGVLTAIVLDGLAGEADFDHNGTVTARELEAYVYRGSLTFTEQYKASGGVHPRTIFSGQDFAIALTDSGVLTAKYAKMDAAGLQTALDELKPKTVALSNVDNGQIRVMEMAKAPLVAEKAEIDEQLYKGFGIGKFMGSPDKTRLKQKSQAKADDIKKIDDEIAAKKAELEAKKKELERLNAEIAVVEKALAANTKQPAPATRAEIAAPPAAATPDEAPRRGQDYALLLANDQYASWSGLKNPYNDVTAIAGELEKRYSFKKENIAILHNLTKAQMDDVIDHYKGDGRASQVYSGDGPYDAKNYRSVSFAPDDQLFVFFAGHGHVYEVGKDGAGRPVVNGLLVAADSPKFSKADKDKFIRLDDLLTDVNLIPNNHIMIVFDACFSGQIWKPKVLPLKEMALAPPPRPPSFITASFGNAFAPAGTYLADMSRARYIRQNLGSRSRVVFTSGGEAVPDGYCEELKDQICIKYSEHSPFAAKFIEALKQNGKNFNVLLGYEMIPYFKTLDKQRVEKGRLDDISDGDFLFIAPSEK